jgi:hypothetical protein
MFPCRPFTALSRYPATIFWFGEPDPEGLARASGWLGRKPKNRLDLAPDTIKSLAPGVFFSDQSEAGKPH